MDDMTWMSSFYEPPLQLSKRQLVSGFWAAAMMLAAIGCGGALLMAWSQIAWSAGLAGAYALPVP